MSHTAPRLPVAQSGLAGPTVAFPPKARGRNPSFALEKEKPQGNARSPPGEAEHQAEQCLAWLLRWVWGAHGETHRSGGLQGIIPQNNSIPRGQLGFLMQ